MTGGPPRATPHHLYHRHHSLGKRLLIHAGTPELVWTVPDTSLGEELLGFIKPLEDKGAFFPRSRLAAWPAKEYRLPHARTPLSFP